MRHSSFATATAALMCSAVFALTGCSSGSSGATSSAPAVATAASRDDIAALCAQIVEQKLSPDAAAASAEGSGYTSRIGSVDGEANALTMDYREDRMTFTVVGDVVKAVHDFDSFFHIFIMLNRGDYWQCGFVIPKGARPEIEANGLAVFRENVAKMAPFAANRVGELQSWDEIKLLTVQVDRLRQWARPGLLCIGDGDFRQCVAPGTCANASASCRFLPCCAGLSCLGSSDGGGGGGGNPVCGVPTTFSGCSGFGMSCRRRC